MKILCTFTGVVWRALDKSQLRQNDKRGRHDYLYSSGFQNKKRRKMSSLSAEISPERQRFTVSVYSGDGFEIIFPLRIRATYVL